MKKWFVLVSNVPASGGDDPVVVPTESLNIVEHDTNGLLGEPTWHGNPEVLFDQEQIWPMIGYLEIEGKRFAYGCFMANGPAAQRNFMFRYDLDAETVERYSWDKVLGKDFHSNGNICIFPDGDIHWFIEDHNEKLFGKKTKAPGDITNDTVTASSINTNMRLQIKEVGNTNWISLGAASNMAGIEFKATMNGNGEGVAYLADTGWIDTIEYTEGRPAYPNQNLIGSRCWMMHRRYNGNNPNRIGLTYSDDKWTTAAPMLEVAEILGGIKGAYPNAIHSTTHHYICFQQNVGTGDIYEKLFCFYHQDGVNFSSLGDGFTRNVPADGVVSNNNILDNCQVKSGDRFAVRGMGYIELGPKRVLIYASDDIGERTVWINDGDDWIRKVLDFSPYGYTGFGGNPCAVVNRAGGVLSIMGRATEEATGETHTILANSSDEYDTFNVTLVAKENWQRFYKTYNTTDPDKTVVACMKRIFLGTGGKGAKTGQSNVIFVSGW